VKNDYSILGMLSRGKYSPPPCGEGRGVGCNLRKDPTLSSLRSDIPPHKGEGKKYPLVGSIMTFSGSSFAGLTRESAAGTRWPDQVRP